MQNLKRHSKPNGHFPTTIDNLLDGLVSPFKISGKLPGCQYSMNFQWHFCYVLFIYSFC